MPSLAAQFKEYLVSQGVSRVTVKNYVSDLAYFTEWYGLYLRRKEEQNLSKDNFFNYLTCEVVAEYRGFLVANQRSTATINRRLSSLRKVGVWGIDMELLSKNPAAEVKNVQEVKEMGARKVLEGFGKYLEEEEMARATRKNYLCDIRQFLVWLESEAG